MTTTAAPFWRMDDPVLAGDGSLEVGGMWRHQREWWDLPHFIKALVTGYGGGKTLTLAKRMIWLALANSPAPVITVSPSYPFALRTIVQTLDELLAGKQRNELALGHDFHYRLIRTQPYEFRIHCNGTDGLIWCMSGERAERLKGPNIGAAGIDEPFIQDRAVFDQVIARVRHPAARHKEINLTGTPEGVVGWGYDICEGEERDRHDIGIVQASTSENRALGADYVQRMEAAYDDAALAAYRDGKFVNMATGRVYHSFDPTTHVVDEDMPAGAELCVGMDFNVDPFAFVVFWRKGQRLHFVAEHELPNCDAEEAAQKIRADYPQVQKVYPDASGRQRSHAGGSKRSAFAYLQEAGFRIESNPANPTVFNRVAAVNGSLRHGRVTLSPRCRKLKTYLLAMIHKDMNKQSHKDMSHLVDAFGYPIAYLFPVDKQSVTLQKFRI